MAKFDYARSKETAVRLIDKFGQAAVLRVKTSTPDPDRWKPPTATTTDYPCTVAVLQFSKREIDGTLIQVGDRRVYIAPDVAVQPATNHSLIVEGEEHQIINVDVMSPAGIPVYYDVQIR
jgi:hypothetical protein